MNVLVTGGAGYIGSHVAADLVAAGHRVTVYDNFSKGHRQAVPPEAELIEGDVADGAAVGEVLRSRAIEAVMHFAAFIEAGESMQQPEKYFRNNTAATMALLEAMIANSVLTFVFSSTAALYGNPDAVPIEETARLEPTNAYGESKLLVERVLAWYHEIHHLRYASLRYFNAAGATVPRGEDHHPESHLIPLILQVALGQREHVHIFGTDYATPDGTCVRDYIHVSDLSQAHLLALNALQTKDRVIYNLGNGRGFSVREVIEVARQVTGHEIPALEAPRRPGDPAVLVASSEKIRRELGWKPQHPELRDIVASAWDWFSRHPEGYR
ncbi:MAG: UDP-glucose 4-epimerase GalE [Candidatus Xenobia bacterium]